MDKELKESFLSSSKSFLGIRITAWVEIFIFFFILFFIAFLAGFSFNYFKTNPHPFWIVVILISAQYGTNAGLLAALISTLILTTGELPPRNVLQDKAEYLFFVGKTPVLWFLTALILGELRLKHIRERDRLKEEVAQAEAKEKKIAEAYNSIKNIKERLELRVTSEMSTALMAINAFRQLESESQQDMLKGTRDLVKTIVSPEKFSIFLLEDSQLKCLISEGWEKTDAFAIFFSKDSLLYKEIIEKKEIVSIQISDPKILDQEGLLAVPIFNEHTGVVSGMIKIEEIPFLRLRTTAIESLKEIGKWVGSSFTKKVKPQGPMVKDEGK